MTPSPIVLTGASGFLARQILVQLLADGHAVRATLRDPARADGVKAAVLPLVPPDAAARLSFVRADLTRDDGWAEAMAGAAALIHTASPFPIAQPRDAEELIRPAVDGTLRALRAAKAAGVTRVVLTSSTTAVVTPGADRVHDESHWTDLNAPGVNPYIRSKTLAERAAWDFTAAEGQGLRLTTVNPGMILGPLVGRDLGSSVGVVLRMLKGSDPMVPRMGLPVVDVRDVARLHVSALATPATEGERMIAVAGSLWFREIAAAIKAAYPNRRIAQREAPKAILRLLGLFDGQIRAILPRINEIERASGAKARRLTGLSYISPADAVQATARSLVEMGLA